MIHDGGGLGLIVRVFMFMSVDTIEVAFHRRRGLPKNIRDRFR